MFDGKTILITGGAGSFGRRFVRAVLERHAPRRLIIYSRDELKHFHMHQELDHPSLRFFIGDVRDRDRLEQAMRDVEFVIHAAALKQVPAAEYNPMECLKTNVHGGENVINAALTCGVRRIIALSSDKAANPINLYGASKLAADKLFTAANNIAGAQDTRFAVVRYGNVVGSNGSVLPFFQSLLARGETTLPVTDRRMTRFWITLRQGVDFVINSFQRMQGGEIFVPRIPSIHITDLVRSLGDDLEIRDVGIRPGEKLAEIMVPAEDARLTLEFGDHFVIKPTLKFFDADVDYQVNARGEKGKPVPDRWEYSSDTNPHFLTVDEIRKVNAEAAA